MQPRKATREHTIIEHGTAHCLVDGKSKFVQPPESSRHGDLPWVAAVRRGPTTLDLFQQVAIHQVDVISKLCHCEHDGATTLTTIQTIINEL